jgi:hypothetical protein
MALLGYAFLPRAPERNRFLNERERTIAMERIRVENAGLVGPFQFHCDSQDLQK